MRIAVMADIHSNHIALETCFAEAQRRNAEEFIFLGDYLDDLAYPQKTLDFLDKIKKQYSCICASAQVSPSHGNCGDRQGDADQTGAATSGP